MGIIALWATREDAETAGAKAVRTAMGTKLGSKAAVFSLFETPLLIDALQQDAQ